MPIYEYQCPACHTVFEEWTTVSEAHAAKPCPHCGNASERVLSHTSFVLKGAGWYVSDYGYRKGVKDEASSTTYGASGAMTPPVGGASESSASSSSSSSEAAGASSTNTSASTSTSTASSSSTPSTASTAAKA